MRKIYRAVLTALLLIMLIVSFASAQSDRVIDDANLFTPEEEKQIAEYIEKFIEKTGMDFVVYTSSDSHHGKTGEQTAEDFYDQNDYGFGDNQSGILYYIDMAERYPYLITTGDMIDYMTDERLDSVLDSITMELRNGDYDGSAQIAVQNVLEYVEKGIPEGQYRYDIVTGQRLTGSHKVLTGAETVVCALIGIVVCAIILGSVKHGYSLKGSTYRYDYQENGERNVTNAVDDYIRTTVQRVRRPQTDGHGSGGGHGGGHSGGSGVHTGSSGISHGGGRGGHF